MKKRSTLALVAAMIVVASGVFISFFLSFSNQDEAHIITLPGQGSAVIDPAHDIQESNHNKVQTISVTAENIQAVIASLERPEQYHCQVETTYYYQDTQTVLKSLLWKSGERIRITQLDAGEQTEREILLTPNWVYLWNAAGSYSRFPRQEKDVDLYSRAPSYEDLIQIPQQQVLVGELREINDVLCLYAESRDALTGEREQWYVAVESGLLLYAAGFLNDTNTYISQITGLELDITDVTDGEVFLLPDGMQPE